MKHIKDGGFFMAEHEIKFCPHCRARYRTILDTCVYCSSRLHSVPEQPDTPEILFVIANLAAILLLCLIVIK